MKAIIEAPRQSVWEERLKPATLLPGKWLRVHEYDSPKTAGRAVQGLKTREFVVPEGKWEFASRTVEGRGYVYARYLGKLEEVT